VAALSWVFMLGSWRCVFASDNRAEAERFAVSKFGMAAPLCPSSFVSVTGRKPVAHF
jgi:hypothetical protein